MKVYIKPEVHAEIMYYVNKSNVEISGLGRIERASNGDMVVTKVYLLDQVNTSASTDISADAVADLMYKTREDKGALNFWWHSHVNMAVFWSGTDMSTIKQFGKNGYLLSTVFNKKGEHRTSYFQGATDFLPEVFIDQIETKFEYLPTSEQTKAWEAEYTAKCKKYTPKQIDHFGNNNFDDNKWWKKQNYGYDDYGFYTGKKKGKKNGKKKGNSAVSTLLADGFDVNGAIASNDSVTSYAKLLNELGSYGYQEWSEWYAEFKGIPISRVDDEKLYNFWLSFDGDFEAMQKYVFANMEDEQQDLTDYFGA